VQVIVGIAWLVACFLSWLFGHIQGSHSNTEEINDLLAELTELRKQAALAQFWQHQENEENGTEATACVTEAS
jgi:hypothetical protein